MNEFMHFKLFFTLCEDFLTGVNETNLLTLLTLLLFLLAVALLAPAGLASLRSYRDPAYQSFKWWSIAESMTWQYLRGVMNLARESDNQDKIEINTRVSPDLLSKNPLRARRARKKFWGREWMIACEKLSSRQRMAIYEERLKKRG
jgi:hypothetical protein